MFRKPESIRLDVRFKPLKLEDLLLANIKTKEEKQSSSLKLIKHDSYVSFDLKYKRFHERISFSLDEVNHALSNPYVLKNNRRLVRLSKYYMPDNIKEFVRLFSIYNLCDPLEECYHKTINVIFGYNNKLEKISILEIDAGYKKVLFKASTFQDRHPRPHFIADSPAAHTQEPTPHPHPRADVPRPS